MAAYQVLARKWRPKTFADLVGQQHVVKALQNALDKGRLHHAYLLTGTRGVGKTTIARILAKSLNCENATHGEPCSVCQSCRDIDAGRFVDLLEIDAASNTGIDNIREVLENAQYAPTVGKYKVYIIDEVHMLSKSAFNAMLKTLEEPPEHVKFILATTDPHKVPITVLSRCLQFVLRNMTTQQVADHLAHVLKTEQIVFEPAALTLLGRAANGSMRDALSLLDQAIAMGSGSVKEADVRHMIGAVDKRYLYELLTFLMEQDGESLIAKAQEMAANAIGFDSALNDLAMLLQRLALLKTVPSAIAADDPERERLLLLAQYFSDEQIQLYYQCVIHGKQDLPLAPDEYAGFVMTLLRMLAFAPFAAKNTPVDSTIEGTQLHNPVEKKMAESGSLKMQPEKAVEPVSQPETVSAPLQPEKIVEQSQPETIEPQNSEDSPPWNTSVTESPQQTQPENISEKVETQPETPAQPFSGSEPNEWQPKPDYAPYPEYDYPPFDDLPSEPYTPEPQPENEPEPIEEEAIDPSEPMPEFTAANWATITRRIGAQVSAAQMSLNHMAWVDFADGVLHLAIDYAHTTRDTLQKAYFDRIAHALTQAYNMPVHIQTCSFEPNKGWETPAMHRERIQLERREQARQALQADKAVQDLQQMFGAKFLDNSLVLKK
ncbi:DNA polymerase III subunit gamma/tau [Kingella negevensis]|uniref:DNA polymerase III subunit gamma/tau n=1 Tax=Kingella negevensis TaxID=1522312 RepID=UPI002549CEF7|nr:DNA polymerase III subunit gamma/tau [Kingella negevensis]MDK4679865.1 DNA polymerase III subunit gamma/tau [Kingella negevensis]MDK4682416.1 DNA polymerase III subunit gamma/tau [Kingella negevensis]MDK4690613.1 DNA polymerase III subunit gamma/tau [Kingella negevensis]MDK4692038.1 DNA polymerase III subunit gamma/tau [Kingella negevensis]MDK4699969.1 DNA polymerase III subunit gamma/tau [Kingella negevensis]